MNISLKAMIKYGIYLAEKEVHMKIIDSHTHIKPCHFIGTVDSMTGIKIEPKGKMKFPDGFVYQFLPTVYQDSSFETDDLIRHMDENGVEKSIILQSLAFQMNSDVIDAIHRYPDRLRGAGIIEPKNIDVLKDIQDFKEKGINILKFEMSSVLGYTHPKGYPDMKFNSELFHHIFDVTDQLKMTVTIDPSTIGGIGYQNIELEDAISRHKKTRFVICHLGYAKSGMEKEDQSRWTKMISLAKFGNVWFDVSAMSDLFCKEGFPYKEAMELLRIFVEKYGTRKIIWGSDIPGSLNLATYSQMIEMFTGCEFLNEQAKEDLFYNNALEAYF